MSDKWNITRPAIQTDKSLSIEPTDILYQYDTPLLFTSKMGLFPILCYKLEELKFSDLFLICQIKNDTISALKNGHLSIRGALSSGVFWISEVNNFQIIRYWPVEDQDLPDDFLPESGLGLFNSFGSVPDALIANETFLSVKFSGRELGHKNFSFRSFKILIDNLYDAVNRVFTPQTLKGARAPLFDFPIAEPRFASLAIEVGHPVFDNNAISRRQKRRNSINVNRSVIRESIYDGRENFFDKTSLLVENFTDVSENEEFKLDDLSFVHAIENLIPSEDTLYEKVEFSAVTNSGVRRIIINEEIGKKIHKNYGIGSFKNVTVLGKIFEVNSESSTFIIKDADNRQITCKIRSDLFSKFEENGFLRSNVKLRLSGKLWKRVRRDYLYSETEPKIIGD